MHSRAFRPIFWYRELYLHHIYPLFYVTALQQEGSIAHRTQSLGFRAACILSVMTSSVFQIREHTLECQHIREYARATAESQEAVLHLAIKQYTPLDNPDPKEGDITIIGAHANGFPKVYNF